MTHAVILAAGASSRMRYPKSLLLVDGVPLVAHHVRRLSTLCSRVLVVTGWAGSMVARALPPGTAVVHNARWHLTGPIESLQLALRRFPGGCVVVQPVDVPPVSGALLSALIATGASAVPRCEGRRGHPVLLGENLVEQLRRTVPAGGLRAVLGGAVEVDTDERGVLDNLNDPRDWSRWLCSTHAGGAPEPGM